DPFTMKDYYGLGAFFNSIDEWGTYDSASFRPSPTLPLPTPVQERALVRLAKEVKAREAKLAENESARESAFLEWLRCDDLSPEVPGQAGHYPLDGIDGGKLVNLADPKSPGTVAAANGLAPGKVGRALRFTGDDPAEFKAAPAKVERDRPFTAAFWL